MEKALHERFGVVLDGFLEHLKHGRTRDAAEIVNAVPDEHIRDFAFFLCQHVEHDLSVLGEEVRYRTHMEMSQIMPSQN